MRTNARCLALPTLALAAALAVAGCASTDGTAARRTSGGMPMPTGSANPGATPATGPHNIADVRFATGMIPHHGQALEMASMATSRATTAQVKAMAASIERGQSPEITRMGGWLTGWDEQVPAATGHTMAMPGLMSPQDMDALSKATGRRFDRMWVQMMIQHHESAVVMATAELASGSNGQAKRLAQSIITSQSKQIATMKVMLPTLSG